MASSSRLFVDLVHKTCGLYPNPSTKVHIEVGDYGALNREDGCFEKAGSIYDNEFRPELKIKESHPVQTTQPEDVFTIATCGLETRPFDEQFTRAYPEIAACRLVRERWQFCNTEQAGLVLLYLPQEHFLSKASVLIPKLAETLRGKVIVTSVYTCPSYVMFQGVGPYREVACGLEEGHETGEGNYFWQTYADLGVWRVVDSRGGANFSPLFSVTKPKPKLPRWKRMFGLR